MNQRKAFVRAICENPNDNTPRLVFADWLEDHGEPDQAEFIRLQINLANLPEGEWSETTLSLRSQRAREKELLEAHRDEWTAPLKEFEGNRTDDYYIFRRGFVEAISSDGEIMIEEGERVFELAPVQEILFADEEAYDDLARCKWLLRLHTLELTGSGLSHHFNPAPLIKSRYLANLTTFHLGGEDDNGHLDMAGIKALIASKYLGKLETLDLSGNWLNQFNDNTFSHFLTAKNLPSLRNLNLARVEIGNSGAIALARSSWANQLKVLNLSRNYIGDAGCRAILESPLVDHLEKLDLRGNIEGEPREDALPVTEETKQLLVERFGDRVIL